MKTRPSIDLEVQLPDDVAMWMLRELAKYGTLQHTPMPQELKGRLLDEIERGVKQMRRKLDEQRSAQS